MMAIPKRTRYLVLRRDNFSCRYCGLSAKITPLHIDHVIPRSVGGSDDPSNLTAACQDCNLGKSDSAPDHALAREVRRDHADFMERHSQLVKRCAWCDRLFPLPRDRPEQDVTECDDCDGLSQKEFCLGYDVGFKRAKEGHDQ